MNIENMASKQLRVGVKNGMSTEDFCMKYSCTEDEFHARIAQLYGHNKKDSEELLSSIRANDKKVKRSAKTASVCNKQTAQEIAEAISQQMQCESVEILESVNSGQTELDSLLELEESLSQEVMAIEGKHKNEVEAHRECLKGMREIKDSIALFQASIKDATKEFEALVERANIHVENMNRLSDERRPLVEQLSSARERIEELKTITLAVYDSGEIAVLEQEFALDDTGYEEVYARLLDDSRCEELRMKDIKALARLTQIVSHLEGSKVILLFDRPEVEEVYKKLSGEQ